MKPSLIQMNKNRLYQRYKYTSCVFTVIRIQTHMYSYSVNNHKLSIEKLFSDYQLYKQVTTIWAKILYFSCSLCRVISNWCLCIGKSFVHHTKSKKTAKDSSLKVSSLIIYGRSGSRVYKGHNKICHHCCCGGQLRYTLSQCMKHTGLACKAYQQQGVWRHSPRNI